MTHDHVFRQIEEQSNTLAYGLLDLRGGIQHKHKLLIQAGREVLFHTGRALEPVSRLAVRAHHNNVPGHK